VPTFPFGSLGGLGFLDSFGGGFRCGRFRLRRRSNFLLQMIKFIFNGEGAPYCGEEARGLEDRYLGVKLLSSCALSLGGRSPSSMFSIAQGTVWHV
jgi:hypothetical protein